MQNKIVLVVGFRGSGKSTVASSILKANNGIFLFDPHFDPAYSWIRNTARTVEQLNDYSRWQREARFKRIGLRYVPDGRLDPYNALEEFCAWVWTWRNIWLCVEEVAESCRSVSSVGMPSELRRAVSQGRHKLINQIYCGLRYGEIPRPISAGTDVQIIFATREPGDLDAMRTRVGSEAAEKVSELERHSALIFFPDRSFQIIGSRDPGVAEHSRQSEPRDADCRASSLLPAARMGHRRRVRRRGCQRRKGTPAATGQNAC